MIYIYNCFGGTHSSSLAACVHLKKLPWDRVPTTEEINKVDYFDDLDDDDFGRFFYRGSDENGDKVFTLGRGSSKVLIPCLKNFTVLLYKDYGLKERIVLSNVSPAVTYDMTIGGFLTKQLHLKSIGYPMLVHGARKTHFNIVKIVDRTIKSATSSVDAVLLLENTLKM